MIIYDSIHSWRRKTIPGLTLVSISLTLLSFLGLCWIAVSHQKKQEAVQKATVPAMFQAPPSCTDRSTHVSRALLLEKLVYDNLWGKSNIWLKPTNFSHNGILARMSHIVVFPKRGTQGAWGGCVWCEGAAYEWLDCVIMWHIFVRLVCLKLCLTTLTGFRGHVKGVWQKGAWRRHTKGLQRVVQRGTSHSQLPCILLLVLAEKTNKRFLSCQLRLWLFVDHSRN